MHSNHQLIFLNLFSLALFILPFVLGMVVILKSFGILRWSILLPTTFLSVSVGIQIVSYSGMLNSQTIFILWILCLILVCFFWRDLIQSFRFLFRKIKQSLLLHAVGVSCVIFLLNRFVWTGSDGLGALYPQTTCDVSLYHLSGPAHFLQTESWFNAWWLRCPWHPELLHSMFSAVILWGRELLGRGDLAPAFLQTVLIFFSAAVVSDILGKWTWVWLILFLSAPIAQYLGKIAYLDLANTFFVTSVFVQFWLYLSSKDPKNLYFGLLFSVAGFCTKHMGGIYSACLFFSLLPFSWKSVLKDILTRRGVLVGLGSLTILSVFYGKNFFFSSNPIFPFGFFDPSNLFFWSKSDVISFFGAVSQWKPSSLSSWILSVWDLGSDRLKYSDSLSYWFGPLWTCVFFLLFGISISMVRTKSQSQAKYHLLYFPVCALLIYALWISSSPVIRYLVPQFSVSLVGLLFVLVKLSVRWRLLFLSILGVAGFHSVQAVNFGSELPAPTTKQEIRNFLTSRLWSFPAYEYIEDNLPTTSVFYKIHDECPSLYFPRPNLGDWFGLGGYEHLLRKTNEERKIYFSSFRITHVLHNRSVEGIHFDALIGDYEKCLEKVKSFEMVDIYRIKTKNLSCYDESIPPHPGYSDLVESHPRSLIPFWK